MGMQFEKLNPKFRMSLIGASMLLFVGFVLGLFISANPTHEERARAVYFPLVRALELHHAKFGKYPKKLVELKQSTPTFDLMPLENYDINDECLGVTQYCLHQDGSYGIMFPGNFGIVCEFSSGDDIDFRCDD